MRDDDRLYEAMNARRDEMAWDERYERFYMASQELAEELVQREHLVKMLPAYVEARGERDMAGKHVEMIGKLFKAYLERHEDEVLWTEHADGDIEAKLQHRKGTESYDVTSMPPELVLQLHQARALQVDVKVIRALAGKDILPEDIKRYQIPGPETTALMVEQKR